ncbi:MAG TPA: 2-aminoethylphosphonate ABC transporter permease subunit, partial [Alphaproteobacteria bacterium]|nr:2-aminoethylphosphonate ABC transporter permease subunit [Alphaproteobacteria bacterium]
MADIAIAGTSRRESGLWIAPPLLVLAGLFFYPLSLIVRQALTGDHGPVSLDQFAAVIQSGLFVGALLHTIEIAIAASVGCLILGFTIALVLAFVPFPGSREVARFIDTFIALPTFLAALAFTFIYGSAGVLNRALIELFGFEQAPIDFLYSPSGVVLAEVTVYTPFVLRPLLAAFSLIDLAQLEVASSLGARSWRIIREIILPAAMPALLAGGSLCLLLTVNEFGIVLFIGAKGVITLPLLIYSKAIQESDYQA